MRTRIAAALLALAAATVSIAQDYGFEVPRVLVEAWVEPEGTVTMESTFSIVNAPDARALDGVDVGMPTRQWSLGRVRARSGGVDLEVVDSPYVDNAAAANLPDGGLAPGAAADVWVRAEGLGGLLFSDTTAPDRVSMRVTPTWFDGNFLRGESDVRVVIHLPPGVPADDLRWHAVKWVGQVVVEATPDRPEHAAVVFERRYRFTGPWEVGVSFPRYAPAATPGAPRVALVQGVREITTWDLFDAWARSVLAITTIAFLAAFTLLFFWATRRTGCVVWVLLSGALLVAFLIVPPLPILLAPLLPLAAWGVLAARRRTRRAYVPAVASVEGGGIKRGLTAPEAACLLEAPPEKILLLVLYGLSRKGLVTLEDREKRVMARATPGFGEDPKKDLELAAAKGAVLHPYESAFLAKLRSETPQDVATIEWRKPLRGVAEAAAVRLQGYDVEQTRDYYRQIVARAWKEAASIGDVTLRKEAVDRTFDWLVLEPTAWKRMRSWDRSGWRYSNPWLPVPGAPRGTVGGGGAAPPPLPDVKASDVAGSVGSRMEGFAGTLASTLGVGSSAQGVFSKVDKVSGEAFQSILTEMAKGSKGGSGGSGGGFSCACACAGCACACACAGGGR